MTSTATLSILPSGHSRAIWFDPELLGEAITPPDTRLITERCAGIICGTASSMAAHTRLPQALAAICANSDAQLAGRQYIVSDFRPPNAVLAEVVPPLLIDDSRRESPPHLIIRFFIAPPTPTSRRAAAATVVAAPRLGDPAAEANLARQNIRISATQPYASSDAISHSYGVLFDRAAAVIAMAHLAVDAVQNHYPGEVRALLDLRMAERFLGADELAVFIQEITEG